MADENLIGLGACPVCGKPEARFTLSKAKLVVCTCRQSRCGIQLFSRNGDADEKLRAFIGTASPEPAMPPAPAPSPAPAAPAKTPVPDPAPPAPEKTGPGWGLFGVKHG